MEKNKGLKIIDRIFVLSIIVFSCIFTYKHFFTSIYSIDKSDLTLGTKEINVDKDFKLEILDSKQSIINEGNLHYLPMIYVNQKLNCDGSPQLNSLPIPSISCVSYSAIMNAQYLGILNAHNCEELRDMLIKPENGIFPIYKDQQYNLSYTLKAVAKDVPIDKNNLQDFTVHF